MKKNTILVLSNSFPGLNNTKGQKGGGTFILTECKALMDAGYFIKVIMPMKKGEDKFENNPRIAIKRFTYPFMKLGNSYYGKTLVIGKGFSYYLSMLFMFSFFVIHTTLEILGDRNIRLIWANWLQIGMVAKVANVRKLPILVTIRGSDIRPFPKKMISQMARLVPNALNMFPADDEVLGWLREFKFREITVPSVYSSRNIDISKREANHIVILGRLDGEPEVAYLKGIGENLFEILGEIQKDRQDVKITVIGDGAKAEHFRSFFSGSTENVTFTGHLSEFDEWLSRASFVIGGGGLNGVVMDTTPFQVPILVSKNFVGKLWKEQHNCLVYDPNSKKQFRHTIEFAIDNPILMRQLAEQAQKDLMQFARPVNEAGVIWSREIEKFLGAGH